MLSTKASTARKVVSQENGAARHPFQVLKPIGVGSGGSVYLCRLLAGPLEGHLVAIKKTNKASPEKSALTALNGHPMIVAMVGWLPTNDQSFELLLLEYVAGRELFDIINEGNIPDQVINFVFWQLVDCLEFIHGRGLVHGDLKPENILVDASYRIKLIDFGMSRLRDKPCKGLWGSVEYAPPEMKGACKAGSPKWYDPVKAEMWSLGVVLYTMVHRHLPIGSTLGENIKSPLSFVIASLMNEDPESRPSCSELKSQYIAANQQQHY
jgi:serine/threonine protein kinase